MRRERVDGPARTCPMNSDTYKQIILAQLHAVLKPRGFRKKQTLFSAERGDAVLFVQLQSSQKSTKDVLIATVNLGIFSRTIAERVGNTHDPNIRESHWRKRIGMFLPESSDKWWEIHSENEANSCATEITSLLTQSVLPEMETLASTENLKSLWREGKSPGIGENQRRQYLQVLDDIATI